MYLSNLTISTQTVEDDTFDPAHTQAVRGFTKVCIHTHTPAGMYYSSTTDNGRKVKTSKSSLQQRLRYIREAEQHALEHRERLHSRGTGS